MTSLTIENYVKTIYQLNANQEGGPAATGQIASALGVSPGTVTSMLKTLNDSGLAAYTPYEGVALTDAGRALALRVLRRHRLIELFLVRTLQLSWDEVHDEAENMEHAVSDYLVDRMDAFLDFPDRDPHGDPIPRADGSIAAPDVHSLAEWHPGRSFRLVQVVDQSPEFLRFLSAAGIEIGRVGRVERRQVEAGTIDVVVGGTAATLGAEAAEKLMVAGLGDEAG